jgi:hypothetical protein
LKKQYVIGANMVLILLCALAQMMTSVVRDEPFLPAGFSGTTATLIGMGILVVLP